MRLAPFSSELGEGHGLDCLNSQIAFDAPIWWSDHWRYGQIDPGMAPLDSDVNVIFGRRLEHADTLAPEIALEVAIDQWADNERHRPQIERIKAKIAKSARKRMMAAIRAFPIPPLAETTEQVERLVARPPLSITQFFENCRREQRGQHFTPRPPKRQEPKQEPDWQAEADIVLAAIEKQKWAHHAAKLLQDHPVEVLAQWPPATCSLRTRKVIVHLNSRGGSAKLT